MLELQPSEPEPQPCPQSPEIYLLPPTEKQRGDFTLDPERTAQKETVEAIVKNILILTEYESDQALYRRGRVWNLPECTVHVGRYGFFDYGLPGSSHAKALYNAELKSRVVGMEIHYPTPGAEDEIPDYIVESYRVDKDEHGEYILKSLTYDDDEISERATIVTEEDALGLLELLKFIEDY